MTMSGLPTLRKTLFGMFEAFPWFAEHGQSLACLAVAGVGVRVLVPIRATPVSDAARRSVLRITEATDFVITGAAEQFVRISAGPLVGHNLPVLQNSGVPAVHLFTRRANLERLRGVAALLPVRGRARGPLAIPPQVWESAWRVAQQAQAQD